MENFHWPEYPQDVSFSKRLEKQWQSFKEQCNAKIAELESAQKENEFEAAYQKRVQLVMEASQNGQYISLFPEYAPKAMVKLRYLLDSDGIPDQGFTFNKDMQPVLSAIEKIKEFDDNLDQEMAAFRKKYEDKFGEGKSNPLQAACSEENNINNNYLKSVNGMMERVNKTFLSNFKHKASDHLYYLQYTVWPEQFELDKINAQISWLRFISTQKVAFKDKSSYCQPQIQKDLKASLGNYG